MNEPIYQYVKGSGWVPQVDLFVIKQHKGKTYRVYARSINVKKATRVIRFFKPASEATEAEILTALKEVVWWETWGECPEGFGPANELLYDNDRMMEVVTEEV